MAMEMVMVMEMATWRLNLAKINKAIQQATTNKQQQLPRWVQLQFLCHKKFYFFFFFDLGFGPWFKGRGGRGLAKSWPK